MRRLVVLADVGLDLDDPARPPIRAGVALPNERQPDQRRSDLEGRPAEERPEIVQDSGVGAGTGLK